MTEGITTVAEPALPTPAPVSRYLADGGERGRRAKAGRDQLVAGVAVIAAIAVGAYVQRERAAPRTARTAPMAGEVPGTITGAALGQGLKMSEPVPLAPPLMLPPLPNGRILLQRLRRPARPVLQAWWCSAQNST